MSSSSSSSTNSGVPAPFRVIEGSDFYEIGTNKIMHLNEESTQRTAASFDWDEENNPSSRRRPKKLSNLGSFKNMIGKLASSPTSASSTNYSKFDDGDKKRKSSFFRTKSDDDDLL